MPVSIDIRADTKRTVKQLSRVQRKVIPLATAKAMTFTAERIQKRQTQLIPQIFSNPTPTTRKSVFKTSATVRKLTASVFIKDVRGELNWLLHHIEGGPRRQKGSERRGRLGAWTAAGRKAKRNKYGNIPRATYAKMFADAQLTGKFAGDYSSTKGKRAGGTKQIKYFAGRSKSGKRVIYQKLGGKGNPHIIPVLVETRQPRYRKRWPFYKVGNSIIKRQFPILFRKSVDRELRKLKL